MKATRLLEKDHAVEEIFGRDVLEDLGARLQSRKDELMDSKPPSHAGR